VQQQETLAVAIEHHKAGRLAEAARLYEDILEVEPHHVDALHMRGLIAWQHGKPERAVELIGQALTLSPDFAEAHCNLGNALQAQGRLEEAEAAFRKALELQPGFAEAHYNLGNTLLAAEKHEDAVAAYRQALALKPDHVPAMENLGEAFLRLGGLDEAMEVFEKILQFKPERAHTHFKIGNVFYDSYRYHDAEASYRKALELDPDHLEVRLNLATTLRRLRRRAEANELYKHLLARPPRDPNLLNKLGNILIVDEQWNEAIALLQRAVELRPDFAEAHLNLGLALRGGTRFEESLLAYRRAIELQPNLAKALLELGKVSSERKERGEAVEFFQRALRSDSASASTCVDLAREFSGLGRRDEARECFDKAFALHSASPHAYIHYADFHSFTSDDPAIDKMESLLAAEDISRTSACCLNFALGKAYEGIDRHDDAFISFETGNRLRLEELEHAEEEVYWNWDAVREAWGERRAHGNDFRDSIARHESKRDNGLIPVFIIGLSRGGRSLVNSVIDQHPAAFGADEASDWVDAIGKIATQERIAEPFPQLLARYTKLAVRDISRLYMDTIRRRSPNSRVIANSNPNNLSCSTLILEGLPNAKIIHCVRHPMDHCLSIYFKLYETDHKYSYDLESLANFYLGYARFMNECYRLFGDRILTVQYEELIHSPLDVAERIFEHCDLDFDPAALQLQFKDSEIGRWRHYERQLRDLRERLGEIAEALPAGELKRRGTHR
jgi:tetratricopeptide (TPR) repeat protein